MAICVIMPALDVTQESGKLLAWKKKAGERVAKGEALLEVETDKAVVEVEAPGDGILAGICAQDGAVVGFGQTIAWLVQEGEAVPEASSTKPKPVAKPQETARPAAPSDRSARGAARISPKARRLAEEHGIDPASVRGSGAGGEILAEDVLALSNAGGQELSAAARLAGERTTQGWSSIPHIFVTREIDAGPLAQARNRVAPDIEKRHKVKPSLNDLIVALAARVALKHPRVNARFAQGKVHYNADVNMGIAIALGDAVAAGVIRKAHELDLGEIALKRAGLTERARAGKLAPEDISGATFTLSSLGMFGVDAFTAIIVPPQAAILAVGRIKDQVVALDGKPAIRPMVNVTLSLDHRIGGGVTAAQFLAELAEALDNPAKWL